MFARNFLLSALALLAASGVQAQDLSQLPTCAQSCAIGGISSTGCALTDFKCICSASSFLTSVGTCVNTACSAADVEKTLAFASSLCASVGVTIPTTPAAGSPTTTPNSSPTTTPNGSPTTMYSPPYPTGNATIIAPTGSASNPPAFEGAAGRVGAGSWVGGVVAVAGLVWIL